MVRRHRITVGQEPEPELWTGGEDGKSAAPLERSTRVLWESVLGDE